jgi:hypothetical protein
MPKNPYIRQFVVQGVPFEKDLLDFDLDARFGDFFEGKPVGWGLAVAAVENSWEHEAHVRGQDWEMVMFPPGKLKVPDPDRLRLRMRWHTIRQECGLFVVRTGKSSVNEARDVGRTCTRALLGLVRREFPLFLPGEILWEGPLASTSRGLKMASALTDIESRKPMPPNEITRRGLRLAEVSVLRLPSPISRALQWLALARGANVKAERFTHLWLAVRAIADYGRPNKGHQMTRIKQYTATMGFGIGGVLSPLRIQELNDKIARAYQLRTALFHRDDDSGINEASLRELEEVAFQLVDFELAKAGIKIRM